MWESEFERKSEAQKAMRAMKGSLSNRGTLSFRRGMKTFICFHCSGDFNFVSMVPVIEDFRETKKVIRPLCPGCNAIRVAEGLSNENGSNS